jgi:hypothetical protein
MDAITIMLALVLQVNEPCTEMPPRVTDVGGETYRIQPLRCGDTTIRVWSYRCHVAMSGETYWSRPFLMEDDRTGEGIYLNRFAELQAGWHVGLNELYRPACGV